MHIADIITTSAPLKEEGVMQGIRNVWDAAKRGYHHGRHTVSGMGGPKSTLTDITQAANKLDPANKKRLSDMLTSTNTEVLVDILQTVNNLDDAGKRQFIKFLSK